MLNKIQSEETCLFCEPEAYDQAEQVLLRSDNFYLFAALGPMVEGYIIIVPHRCDNPGSPFHSYADIPPILLDEVIYLCGLVSEFYRDVYDQEASMHFEHAKAGVCFPRARDPKHCYHAHLCCYPCSFPLWDDMEGFNIKEIEGLPELKKAVGSRRYLLVQSSYINHEVPYDAALREYWVSKVAVLEEESLVPSQYLRRLLAARLGDKYGWEWAAFPRMDRVEKLINAFHNWLPTANKYELREDENGVKKLDFLKSIERSNRVGNNHVSQDYHKTWGGRVQYRAIGRFLSKFPENQEERPRVLDVGCGPGLYIKAFYSMGIECVGIDVSEEMVKIARRVVGFDKVENDTDNVTPLPRIENMSVFDLEFEAESFDGIWCSAVLVHVPRGQLSANLFSLHKMLKDDGVLYVSAQIGSGSIVRREGRVFFYFGEDELKYFFDEAGFRIIEQWGGETSISSTGSKRKKSWMHFLLKKEESKYYQTWGNGAY